MINQIVKDKTNRILKFNLKKLKNINYSVKLMFRIFQIAFGEHIFNEINNHE